MYVSYPAARPAGQVGRVADGADAGAHGGFPIGPIPLAYWSNPPNAITAERVTLWRTLLDASAADGG